MVFIGIGRKDGFKGGGRERMAFKGESIVFRGERGRKDGV